METGIKQVSSIHIEKTNDRSELLRADEVVGATLKNITEDALQCMSTEERLLFLEQVVSILIADRYGYDLDKEKEDMLDELCEEKFFDI